MKRFYNNTLMSGAFSKALRVVALLCVLLGFSGSAWGAKYYIDASCISGVQQISWLQATGGNSSGDLIPQNTTFDGKSAFQFEANSGTIVRMQLKISSNGQVKYPAIHNISLSSSNCIELSYDGNNLGHTMKTYSTLKCAGGCTPSATITGAEYKNGKISLSGTLTETCNDETYYGWQWMCLGDATWNATHIEGTYPDKTSHHTISKGHNYSASWDKFETGKTYIFRAYAYQNSTFFTDGRTLSVYIPTSEEEEEESNCDKIIYLKPNANWKKDDAARFAIYFFNSTSSKWINMTATTGDDCSGLYHAEIPDGYTSLIFCRMNKNIEENSWTNDNGNGPFWNKTSDLVVPTDNNNLYTIYDDAWSTDDEGSLIGKWSESTCTEGCTIPGSGSLVLSTKPIVNKQNKVATVSAYFRNNSNCKTISEYGFVYCTTATERPCDPSASSNKVTKNGSLERGQEYSQNISELEDGLTYYYRAYIKFADGSTMLSKDVNSFAMDPCIPQECCGTKAIVYTIDATFSKDNLCKLQFRNLQTAIDHLRETSDLESDNKFKYVTKSGDSYNLNQPVEMRVVYYDDTPDDPTSAYIYRGTTDVGVYAGDNKPANANLIQDFNKSANVDPANTLTIKAGTKVAKPWIHHLVIRNSRNIVLDSLCIYSDPNKVGDNALEIDVNSTGWDVMTTGQFADANIVIQNSMIGSDGFTGVHASAYDGITFKKNDFEIVFEGKTTDGNVLNWSASAKFMMCKNIKFIQNNFRGSQPTMLWLQECQNALFMNNVFWNTNTFIPAEGSKAVVPSAVRLVSQYANVIDNIGFYYNTFYFANNDINAPWAKYNFFNQYLAYTNAIQTNIGKYGSNIYFKYNNCYSYDKDCPGMYDIVGSATGGGANMTYTTVTATSDSENFCPNNFWSQYDQDKLDKGETVTKSAFAFGCADNEFINVKSQVCSTTASGPASLIVKGKGMDYGVKPNISTTGITLEPNEQYADRYIIGARPAKGEKWTYGAYQSKDEIPTQTIYWVGKTSDWDDRNNWEYETEVAGQMVRQRVSCVNTLSENLKVIIEEIGTYEITGGRKWPVIPASFTENRTNSDYGEHVSAGLGTIDNPTKFADHIEVEYGAGIIGVENLNKAGDQLRYTSAATNLVAPRSQWLLVGPVIKPFNEETKDIKDDVRNIVSNDYFLNHFPAVYMKGAYLTKDNEGNVLAKWDASFPDLDKEVIQKSAYAIELPDEYGTEKNTASYYNATFGTSYDPTEAHPYRFNGRFYTEDSELIYTGLTKNEPVLLNNTYPANIDACKLNTEKGTVQIYNYTNKSFEAPKEGSAILSQHAFVFTPKENRLEINKEYFLNTSTRHRSSAIVNPNCRVEVRNTKYNTASNVVVMVDEFKDDEADYSVDAPKIYNGMEKSLPDMYVMRYDKTWSGIRVPYMEEAIPLGIRVNRKNTPVEFNLVSKEELGDVILEDRAEGKFYNLSEGEKCTVSDLQKGECIGRFFLYLSEPNMEEDDDNVTTEVEEEVSSENGIIIMTKENSVVVSCSADIELRTIYINDMSGKTAMFNVSGQYAEIELPVAKGVYTVNVIGDTATKTGKVILK